MYGIGTIKNINYLLSEPMPKDAIERWKLLDQNSSEFVEPRLAELTKPQRSVLAEKPIQNLRTGLVDSPLNETMKGFQADVIPKKWRQSLRSRHATISISNVAIDRESVCANSKLLNLSPVQTLRTMIRINPVTGIAQNKFMLAPNCNPIGINQSGSHVITIGGGNNRVDFWSLKSGQCKLSFEPYNNGDQKKVLFTHILDKDRISTLGERFFTIWKLPDCVAEKEIDFGSISCAKLSPSGKFVGGIVEEKFLMINVANGDIVLSVPLQHQLQVYLLLSGRTICDCLHRPTLRANRFAERQRE